MNNPFDRLVDLMKQWESLGRGKVENYRKIAYGEVDRSKPSRGLGWVHSHFLPLNEEEISLIELEHNVKFPPSLKYLYLTLSCAELFRDLFVINGFWSNRLGNLTSTFCSMRGPGNSNLYQTEYGMYIAVTSHHYDQLGWAHLDFETGEVDLYVRPTNGELALEKSFDSLEDYIFEMYEHFDRLFDRETGWRTGKLIGEP